MDLSVKQQCGTMYTNPLFFTEVWCTSIVHSLKKPVCWPTLEDRDSWLAQKGKQMI